MIQWPFFSLIARMLLADISFISTWVPLSRRSEGIIRQRTLLEQPDSFWKFH